MIKSFKIYIWKFHTWVLYLHHFYPSICPLHLFPCSPHSLFRVEQLKQNNRLVGSLLGKTHSLSGQPLTLFSASSKHGILWNLLHPHWQFNWCAHFFILYLLTTLLWFYMWSVSLMLNTGSLRKVPGSVSYKLSSCSFRKLLWQRPTPFSARPLFGCVELWLLPQRDLAAANLGWADPRLPHSRVPWGRRQLLSPLLLILCCPCLCIRLRTGWSWG